jgi:hypothetical protein
MEFTVVVVTVDSICSERVVIAWTSEVTEAIIEPNVRALRTAKVIGVFMVFLHQVKRTLGGTGSEADALEGMTCPLD